ncbi:MAG TPA: cytochrome c [Bryobacteraceae bacterium]|jgi:mono/diheme cytochrome c family protein|nr:cytochrome c [Bryobacteraceae bacterium]
MRIAIILLFAAVFAIAQSPTGDAKHGKELFLSYSCYSCHSFDGHGGAGARLVPMPLNQAAFIAFVRNAGRMPSYSSKVLPDAQLADIYAYIKTLPASRDAKSIPLIQQLLKED